MTERERIALIHGGTSVASLFLLGLLVLIFHGCHQMALTERTAMEHGYISDRGEWRKQ